MQKHPPLARHAGSLVLGCAVGLMLGSRLATPAFADPAPATAPPGTADAASRDAILDAMGTLENVRDPKCHATASRLEDFMYGTPLELAARVEKTRWQKGVVWTAWTTGSSAARARGGATVTVDDVRAPLDALAALSVPEWARSNPPYSSNTDALGDWTIATAHGPAVVRARDLRQYGSVAYALRAILAVQQEDLLDASSTLLPLTPEAVAEIKRRLDVMTLAALQEADRAARRQNRREIDAATFRAAWNGAFPAAKLPPASSAGRASADAADAAVAAGSAVPAAERFTTIRAVVREKLTAYEKYNDLTMPVFLRNIQVYFARHRWPTDTAESNALREAFTSTMVAFTHDLLLEAEKDARAHGHDLVREDDVHQALERFLPYRANAFEDILYFPRLPREERVQIEAYDLDSFRDPGLHWVYLDTVLADPNYPGTLEPDPFGAELFVEGVAQFGVLVLRMAGDVARERDAPRLAVVHLEEGLKRIQARIDRHARLPKTDGSESAPRAALAQATEAGEPGEPRFADVTAKSGIAFSHRLADWAARRIRSLQVTPDGTGKLAIPPAFGGAGVAAEDLDADGDVDIVLLSGGGNRLYANDGKGHFADATAVAGIDWRRADNTAGEPRQPVVADWDGDGILDLLITYLDDDHRVFRGLGGLRFADVTATAGLGGAGLAGGPATAADFDRDGRLDVFIGYFGDWPRGTLPTLSRRSVNAQPDKLFENRSVPGTIRFADVSAGSGVENPGWAQSVGHVDFDGDGRQDLIVGNDFGVNAYYRNVGAKPGEFRFEDWAHRLGVDKPSYTMNVGLTDWNRDGFPDVYISNIVMMNKDEKYVLPDENTPMKFDAKKLSTMRVVETNDFWVSTAERGALSGYAQSPDVGRGRSSTGWAWDADFFDADNDGDDDLYVLNGMNEYAVYSSVHPYFADSPDLKDVIVPVSLQERSVFFANRPADASGRARLEDATDTSGLGLVGNSRSAAFADLDGDGDLDVVINAFLGDAVVYENVTRTQRHWLKLRLKARPGQPGGADAIGAALVVDSATHAGQWRAVTSTIGYLSVHPREQHVGLGADRTANVTVRWPDGSRERFTALAADRRHVLEQGKGSALEESAPRTR
jgi:hypothetical protein